MAEVVLRTDAAVLLNRALLLASINVAVFPLASVVIYLVRMRRATFPSSRRCFPNSLREGLLVGAVVVALALLRMAAFWSPLAAVFIVALAVIIDIVALSQRWTSPLDPA